MVSTGGCNSWAGQTVHLNTLSPFSAPQIRDFHWYEIGGRKLLLTLPCTQACFQFRAFALAASSAVNDLPDL